MPDWKPPVKRERRIVRMVVLLTESENDNLKANAEGGELTVAEYVRAVMDSRGVFDAPESPVEVEDAQEGPQELEGPEPEQHTTEDIDDILETLSSVDGA